MKRTAQFDRTTRDIINAFMECLDEKSFEKIVVSDILGKAMINRSTFYAHFADKYAIVELLQDRYISELTDLVKPFKDERDINFIQIDELMENYFLKNRITLRKLIKIRTEHMDFVSEMKTVFRDYCKSIFQALTELEASMVAGVFVDFFIYYVESDETSRDFSKRLYTSTNKTALALFGIKPSKANADELADFIKSHH